MVRHLNLGVYDFVDASIPPPCGGRLRDPCQNFLLAVEFLPWAIFTRILKHWSETMEVLLEVDPLVVLVAPAIVVNFNPVFLLLGDFSTAPHTGHISHVTTEFLLNVLHRHAAIDWFRCVQQMRFVCLLDVFIELLHLILVKPPMDETHCELGCGEVPTRVSERHHRCQHGVHLVCNPLFVVLERVEVRIEHFANYETIAILVQKLEDFIGKSFELENGVNHLQLVILDLEVCEEFDEGITVPRTSNLSRQFHIF
mmetsp:Transcript_25327/g.49367  ORF Transcript_25327/g.49367 Transcript_25327/m.49367 type:complete len:255 (-) Transcript_25327:223-987(-)